MSSSPLSDHAYTSTQKSPRTLRSFFDDKVVSDIIVKFGGDQEVHVHKIVLIQNSIWFEAALLGGFKESKQDVIDLGDDDDPTAVMSMLKYFYEGDYRLVLDSDDALDQHLAMYRVADLYDVPRLRERASLRFVDCLEQRFRPAPTLMSGDCHRALLNRTVLSIQQVLGPTADTFADSRIQRNVHACIVQHASTLYKNGLFQDLVFKGEMFNETHWQNFAQKTSELLAASASSGINRAVSDDYYEIFQVSDR